METRDLYIAAVVIASISGGYYYFSGKAEKLATENQNITYAAKGIMLTQSDEQGKLYLRASIDAVQQNIKTKTSQLENLNATMYKAGQPHATFKARQGEGRNDNAIIVLKGGVVATQKTQQGLMRLSTSELIGYTNTRQIESKFPVLLTYPRATFSSQGFKADLNTGQYQLFNVRGKYAPNS